MVFLSGDHEEALQEQVSLFDVASCALPLGKEGEQLEAEGQLLYGG